MSSRGQLLNKQQLETPVTGKDKERDNGSHPHKYRHKTSIMKYSEVNPQQFVSRLSSNVIWSSSRANWKTVFHVSISTLWSDGSCHTNFFEIPMHGWLLLYISVVLYYLKCRFYVLRVSFIHCHVDNYVAIVLKKEGKKKLFIWKK